MTSLHFVMLSGALSFGVPIAVALRELFLLSPAPDGRDGPPREPRFTRAPGPLPDGLLPPPMPKHPVRVRVLEHA